MTIAVLLAIGAGEEEITAASVKVDCKLPLVYRRLISERSQRMVLTLVFHRGCADGNSSIPQGRFKVHERVRSEFICAFARRSDGLDRHPLAGVPLICSISTPNFTAIILQSAKEF